MERNMLLAIALSVAVLIAFGMVQSRFFPAPPPVKAKTQTAAQEGRAAPAAASQPAPAAQPASISQTPQAPEKEITVETELYTAVLSTRGGVIKSWRLKKYKEADGRPLEMVPAGAVVRPLLVVPDGMGAAAAGGLAYSADRESVRPGGGGDGTLTLRYAGPGGAGIAKTLRFRDDAYAVELSVESAGGRPYTLYLGEGFGSLTGPDKKSYGHVGPISYVDGGKYKDNPQKMEAAKAYEGRKGWTGVTDKYFLAALMPADGIKAAVEKGPLGLGSVGLRSSSPKEGFLMYAGPKEYDGLKALDNGLDQAVDFGWFTFIAKPLFVALKFFHGKVGNWGWAIIAITVIIKLLFAPLTHKSQKSMKKMQKLQPLFAELKEKYKGDPQRMNREMMEIYKREKVNPMGGCLPMLIQIPVFIALYNVLNNSIELRQAPFALWLTDLSAKDPYYVLPVLMGLSMLVMQKMTPTSMDPKQNQIMMLMPVIMTFMFVGLPSGLVLYFTISNLLSMAQQLYINKYST